MKAAQGSFAKVDRDSLKIGRTYHVTWANKGCQFVLKDVDPDGIHVYLDNPVNKRRKWLKVKLGDLREIRKRSL
jgi:hypothetical protein